MAWGGRPAPDPRRSAPGQPMLQLWTLLEHLKAGRHSCCLQGDGIGVGGGLKVVGRGPRCHLAPAGPSLGNTFPFLPPTRPHHLDRKLSLDGSTTAGPRLARTWAGWPSWTHTEGMGTAEHPTPAKAPQYPHPTRAGTPTFSVLGCEMETHLPPLNPHMRGNRGSEGTGNLPKVKRLGGAGLGFERGPSTCHAM